jgi:hypothetical protein
MALTSRHRPDDEARGDAITTQAFAPVMDLVALGEGIATAAQSEEETIRAGAGAREGVKQESSTGVSRHTGRAMRHAHREERWLTPCG